MPLVCRYALIWGPDSRTTWHPQTTLIEGLETEQVLADKAYDANSLCEKIEAQGGTVVIPPRRHRKKLRDYDRIAYKNRWGIEGFFAKLKQYRRIATRYDKLAANFLGFIKLASIMLWLK